MDPDANLAEQREIITRIQDGADRASNTDVARLAELADALDRWLCNGGSPPRAWTAFQP